MYAWSNPWFRWSVGSLVALTVRRHARRLRLAAVGARRLHAPRALGQHLPRGRRARRTGAAASDGRRPGRGTTEVVLDARDGARRRRRRRRPRRDARAAACTMCHGAHGMSDGRRAEPRRAVPRGRHQAAARLQARRPRERRSCRRSRRRCPTATSRDLAAYYASLPKAAQRAGDRRRRRCRRWCGSATRCATSRRASPAMAASTRSSARRGWKACRRTTWSRSSKAFASGARRNDSHGADAQHGARDDAEEIEEVADFYARKASERRAPPVGVIQL